MDLVASVARKETLSADDYNAEDDNSAAWTTQAIDCVIDGGHLMANERV